MAGELEHIRPTHPSQTNLAARTRNIIWCDAAGNAHSINAVYWSPSNNADDLKLIWLRDHTQKTLLAGELTVCIEYVVPNGENDSDINLSSFAIFTADSESSTTVNVGIFHESGVVVYKSNIDNIDHNTSEKYGLTGERRYIQSISDVVLKKGLKYYIQYTNTNKSFKPAYFSEGSGNYLNWSHGALQTEKSVANLNSVTSYLGVVTDAAVWLAASENALMIWNGSIDGMTNSYAYIRNNVCNNATIIGQTQETLPMAEKDKLLKLSSGSGFMYIGNNYSESSSDVLINNHIYTRTNSLPNTQYAGIKTTAKDVLDDLEQYNFCIYNGSQVKDILYNGRIYQKIANLDVNEELDFSEYTSQGKKYEDLIETSYNANAQSNKWVGTNGSMWSLDVTGNVYKLKAGYTYDWGPNNEGYAANDRPTTTNVIYLLKEGCQPRGGGAQWINPGFILYDGTNDTFLAADGYYMDNTAFTIFDITSLAQAVTEITSIAAAVNHVGNLSVLTQTSYNGDYISSNLRGETVQTGTKFYLEINGREV